MNNLYIHIDSLALEQINSIAQTLQEGCNPLQTSSLVGDMSFTEACRNLRWPLYAISNQTLKEKLISYNLPYISLDYIAKHVCEFFSKKNIRLIVQEWKHFDIIPENMMNILIEATDLHYTHHFYASTSLFMSLFNGLIDEIFTYMQTHDMLKDADAARALKIYSFKNKNAETIDLTKPPCKTVGFPNSKSAHPRVLCLCAISDKGYYWKEVAQYIRDVILLSSFANSHELEELSQHNPLRNLMFHTLNYNYNTEEHSLKALLIIDLLLKFYMQIYHMPDSGGTQ